MTDNQEYANTLMFNFNHSCIDGVSSIKFCNQFLINMNELVNGTSSADQEISSLDLLPQFHDIVTRRRVWHLLYNMLLTYFGLRPMLKFVVKKFEDRKMKKKPNNPYHEQFQPNPEVFNSPVSSRLNIRVFGEKETSDIVQTCRANNCTVTGAIMTAAHSAFCELLKRDKSKDMMLEHWLLINALRFCDPKPNEDYLGFYVYAQNDFNIKYTVDDCVEFWELAKKTTEKIKIYVKKEEYITEETVKGGLMKPIELSKALTDEQVFSKSGCNVVSSLGSFSFGEQKFKTYKLHGCFINNTMHGVNYTFCHYIYTINGKMTWQIVSDLRVRMVNTLSYLQIIVMINLLKTPTVDIEVENVHYFNVTRDQRGSVFKQPRIKCVTETV